jgi:glyoxylase-like metal-dependent hydrolase (beta-lactamase superfamily II)/rhodanese-related sulfurtransferase
VTTPPRVPVSFVDQGLGNSSYLLDLDEGRALVVDPARHPARYLAEAERLGLGVAFVLETHLHADFVSGARELGTLGASVLVPGEGHHGFAVRGLVDGQEVDLGGLTLRAIGTPGHTPEHLAYLLLDGTTPFALFSGGSLLVDSVARTDLIDPEQTDALARSLWRSLQDRILVLPDDVAVYPTHGAGSFCSAPAGGERTTTIGREKRANPLLVAPDEDSFVRQLLGGLGTYPPYFLRLRDVNRAGPHLYGPGEATLPAVRPQDLRRLMAGGVWAVDVRPVEAYARGHVPGSISIALRPQFATWLGWVVPFGEPVVFVVDDAADIAELVRQARNIGYDQLLGVLAGGVDGWASAGYDLETTPLRPVENVSGQVLDVRQHGEYEVGHIRGARNVELGSLTATDVPAEPVAVMCGHGERAMTAASLLACRGHRDVTVLTGGPEDWAQRSGPLEIGG